jgi:hypothetical protein
MKPHIAKFKGVLAQHCKSKNIPSKKIFNDFHVDEAIEQGDLKDLDPIEFATAILWNCCCEDGKFNNATVVFLAVVTYLKECCNDCGNQAFIDLGTMLKAGTTEAAIRKWIDTYFS